LLDLTAGNSIIRSASIYKITMSYIIYIHIHAKYTVSRKRVYSFLCVTLTNLDTVS